MSPSVIESEILKGNSYTYASGSPLFLQSDMSTECVVGIDEAGRGPVLGPMVYGLFYLPTELHHSLLADTYHFDDSKVLTPQRRSSLMEKLTTPDSDLYQHCGWMARVMSARDISAGMLKRRGAYNLNAQAIDATIDLIKATLTQGINVGHIYIDTIGKPDVYQKRLEAIFPGQKFTVAKKADSLFPCVSAASVCAKVTRDLALELSHGSVTVSNSGDGWGSGYPSDVRCTNWLSGNLDPIFGWGLECRFSWGTAKDILEGKSHSAGSDWSGEGSSIVNDNRRISEFFQQGTGEETKTTSIKTWFGGRPTDIAF